MSESPTNKNHSSKRGSNDEKLKVVLTEYESLKREAMERVKLQLQVYPHACMHRNYEGSTLKCARR